MNKLLEKVLKDRNARDLDAMQTYMASVASVGEPWAE